MAQPERALSRPVTASRIRFGTMLFLASELLLFGGLFAAYFGLRSEITPWPPAGAETDLVLGAIETALLVISSVALKLGIDAARVGRMTRLRAWTGVTMLLGIAFLGLELVDYAGLGFEVSSNPFGTMYYTLTGIHGLHVIAGLAVLAVLIGRSLQGAYDDGDVDGAVAMSYYWQFCDATWVLIFLTLYVLR